MKRGGDRGAYQHGEWQSPKVDFAKDEPTEATLEHAADRVGVSRALVASAKALARDAPPEVVELVKRGSMTISGAQDAIAHASDIERMELGQAAPPHEVGSDANRARNDTRKL